MNQEGVLDCCAVCKEETQRRCSRCLNVYYCSTEHQRQDWKRHKSECGSKLPEKGPKNEDKLEERHTDSRVNVGETDSSDTKEAGAKKEISREKEGSTRPLCLKKSVKNIIIEEGKESGVASVSKHKSQISTSNINKSESGTSELPDRNESSVISSVVYTNKDLTKGSAITYEGSSEQEILNESAQQLNTVDFNSSSSIVLKMVNRTEVTVPMMPTYGAEHSRRVKDYPEGSVRNSSVQNSIDVDPSDPWYAVCQTVIRDMTQYGVCLLKNFLGRERGLMVLEEVKRMHKSGIFEAGKVVSNPGSTDAQTVRSDQTTWIDGTEPHCPNIKYLITQVDNIVLRANKMPRNGKMGDFVINGRTKAMVACYPGSGSHYVKHVDNPNKDGRCITAIYYLNLDWDVEKNGGLLRVFPEGTNTVADIEPIFDRMLFFWSDRRNPHEVQPAYKTRYAVTIWYFDAHEREEAQRRFKQSAKPSSSK
ncbi:egl nine homolog 1 [Amyelois transitella]|uniref:egl nine homolog 1 n=1 Tax=Amyelois transitella TaxID=680683 RepID=UPI00067B5529|nr:egl nine homolog 1 [Amyelois transitella]